MNVSRTVCWATVTLISNFQFSVVANANWFCWAKEGERPSAIKINLECGESKKDPVTACRQNVKCVFVTEEVEKHFTEQQRAFDRMIAASIAGASSYEQAMFNATGASQVFAPQLEGERRQYVERNTIEAEVTCEGKVSDGRVECPSPSQCSKARVIELMPAVSAVGGATHEVEPIVEQPKVER